VGSFFAAWVLLGACGWALWHTSSVDLANQRCRGTLEEMQQQHQALFRGQYTMSGACGFLASAAAGTSASSRPPSPSPSLLPRATCYSTSSRPGTVVGLHVLSQRNDTRPNLPDPPARAGAFFLVQDVRKRQKERQRRYHSSKYYESSGDDTDGDDPHARAAKV